MNYKYSSIRCKASVSHWLIGIQKLSLVRSAQRFFNFTVMVGFARRQNVDVYFVRWFSQVRLWLIWSNGHAVFRLLRAVRSA